MPSPLLQLRIPQDLFDWLEAKHPSRGEVAEYVRQLLTAEQMKEAVAPLVPDFDIAERMAVGNVARITNDENGNLAEVEIWTNRKAESTHWSKGQLTTEEWEALNKEQAKGLPADLHDEEGSPLPKPKARRKKSLTEIAATVVDAPHVENAMKATGHNYYAASPQRCNRGACTGTIKPNGHCMICNQRPRIQDW